jgi:CO/xanthine dehydrogenase Mo-binding subunit
LRGEVFVDLGAYVRTNGLIAPRTLAQFFSGPYRVPNMRITSTALLTNKTPAGTYRAPGRYEASFFCERLIELAAGDLGIDLDSQVIVLDDRSRPDGGHNLVLWDEIPVALNEDAEHAEGS